MATCTSEKPRQQEDPVELCKAERFRDDSAEAMYALRLQGLPHLVSSWSPPWKFLLQPTSIPVADLGPTSFGPRCPSQPSPPNQMELSCCVPATSSRLMSLGFKSADDSPLRGQARHGPVRRQCEVLGARADGREQHELLQASFPGSLSQVRSFYFVLTTYSPQTVSERSFFGVEALTATCRGGTLQALARPFGLKGGRSG